MLPTFLICNATVAVSRQPIVNCRAEVFILVNKLYLVIVDDIANLGWRSFLKTVHPMRVLACPHPTPPILSHETVRQKRHTDAKPDSFGRCTTLRVTLIGDTSTKLRHLLTDTKCAEVGCFSALVWDTKPFAGRRTDQIGVHDNLCVNIVVSLVRRRLNWPEQELYGRMTHYECLASRGLRLILTHDVNDPTWWASRTNYCLRRTPGYSGHQLSFVWAFLLCNLTLVLDWYKRYTHL